MSAVLTGPMLPSVFAELFQNQGFTEALIDFIVNNPKIRAKIVGLVDYKIVEEYKLPERVEKTEVRLGLVDPYYMEYLKDKAEENGTKFEPTIPEQISMLNDQLQNVHRCEFQNFPQNVTDYRADFLMRFMENKDNDIPELHNKDEEPCIYVSPKEFKFFIKSYLPEKYQPKSFKNLRKIRRDVFKNAEERYQKKVWVHKGIGGRKQLKLVALKCDQPELSSTQ